MTPQRVLILLGVLLIAAGSLWPIAARLGLGRLPGDIIIRREGFTLYAPIVTCLIVSALLTAIFWFLRR